MLTQNWYAAGHECSMSWLLGFIATWKLALVHDLAELLPPQSCGSKPQRHHCPNREFQVVAQEL
jgi:hypothetical protein